MTTTQSVCFNKTPSNIKGFKGPTPKQKYIFLMISNHTQEQQNISTKI